jgi:tetratricopeptide (TPR) repeat protein
MAGDTTNDQRKDDEEKANLSETLKSRTETLGEEHWDTLETMHDLAYLLKCRGEYDEAERLLQKAVAILERKIGKDDPETIHSMGCLAVVLSEHAKYGEAETIHRQILESKERVLGKEHPQTLRYREKLAWILYNQGKYQKARELYPPPPKQQDPNVIVMEMDDTSRLDEAEKIYRGSMELKERLLGEEDPETLVSMSRLAGWLSGQCKRIEAEMLYRRLLRLREKVLGTDDEATLESKNSLAQVLSELGKYLDAEKILQELVEVQERVFGKNHPKVLKTMGALPMVLKELGRLDDAEKTLRQLVALKSSLHGEEHLETLESMNDLAIVVAEREQYAEAERIFRQIMEIREKALGKGDPKTLSSLSYLAVMLEKQGKCDQAEEILERQPLCSTEAEAEAETEGDVGDTAKEDGFFKYQPLKSTRSTRVINLYPSRYKSATLVCELSEVELDDNNPPSYGAISYACESQTPNKRIFCHGKKFLVTENVEGILRQFRQPEKMSYLWIDAISISQTSTEERDQQILIMEDIYRLADVVAVWLGPSKELTAAAFKYFTTMAQSRHCVLLLLTARVSNTNDFF